VTIRVVRYAPILALTVIALACGDSPNKPGPIINPPPPPVNNTAPVITSITVQGSRRNEPANFADVSETVAVTGAVTDAETNVDLLQYNWTATLGSFTGTGARVSWVAPAAAVTPATVTITLEVVERFGTNQENRVNRTATVALHDSIKEVGDMSVRFLTEFSKPQTNQSVADVMRDFKASVCPVQGEVTDEENSVRNHMQNFFMHEYRVDPARVTVDFGGLCIDAFAQLRSDACAAVPVMWESTDLTTRQRRRTTGTDLLSARFSVADNRYWLCSSHYFANPTLGQQGHRFYTR
jgi:hypothetical protein